jgi:hypothetical protein
MLIIKFAIREAKIMWIVNDNWVMILYFLLTMGTGIVYRKMKSSNKKIKIPNTKKGASFIDDCIDPDSIYELVDRPLEIVLKQMLNLPPETGPVVILVLVLILAYIISREPIKQVSILGVTFFIDKFKSLVIKSGIGFVSGSIFFFIPIGVVSLTTTLLVGSIFFNIALGMGSFECNNLVSKVTTERLFQEKTIGFLETLPEKTPKVFIKGSENTEIYIPTHNDNDFCSSEYSENPVQIHRTCERTYVPLKERTRTLFDLRNEDSTENREKAEPYIKRYKNRRRDINNKRVK